MSCKFITDVAKFDINPPTSTTTHNPMTLQAWLNIVNFNGTGMPILDFSDSVDSELVMTIDTSTHKLHGAVNEYANELLSSAAMSTGVWYCCQISYKSGSSPAFNLYLDGANTNSASGLVGPTGGTAFILGGYGSGFSHSEAYISHVRAWNAELSQAELDAERLSNTVVRTANLWANWPLSTDSLDISGNGRNWTEVGTVNTDFLYDAGVEPSFPIVTPFSPYVFRTA
jgi:hypothetical protein